MRSKIEDGKIIQRQQVFFLPQLLDEEGRKARIEDMRLHATCGSAEGGRDSKDQKRRGAEKVACSANLFLIVLIVIPSNIDSEDSITIVQVKYC